MSEPWVRFEDADLIVVDKPAGVNTHRPDEHAPDGMYEWVQSRRPGVELSVLHRLDKATSGLLLFGKSTTANRSLGSQFESRTVTKRYELLVASDAGRPSTATSDTPIGRQVAHTDFELAASGSGVDLHHAFPRTGRTHQVRIHAELLGMPIVGDREHGGNDAPRLFLHAGGLSFAHPSTGAKVEVSSDLPSSFGAALDGTALDESTSLGVLAALESRAGLFDPADTDCFVWIDRHHDGFDGIRVERLGDAALIVDRRDDGGPLDHLVDALREHAPGTSVFVQRRPGSGRGTVAERVAGASAPDFEVRELGCRYKIDLAASATSTGLFLDQRETRHRLLTSDLSGATVLNTFAHTGSLSVVAAKAGGETLTLDLSKRYLDWARENFVCNDLDPEAHDFVYGDALDWMQRFARKGRTFDMVIADPPSSSTTRGAKRWSVERDLDTLVDGSARVCAPGGRVFVSTNLHRMTWEKFLDKLREGLAAAGRDATIETRTVPLDHRTGPGDPPHLKSAWLTLD